MLIDGLMACGEDAFAKEVARRFCGQLTKMGFPETFNALNGEAEDDPCYGWTQGVYLTLVQTILK
jgi:putative isomerase